MAFISKSLITNPIILKSLFAVAGYEQFCCAFFSFSLLLKDLPMSTLMSSIVLTGLDLMQRYVPSATFIVTARPLVYTVSFSAFFYDLLLIIACLVSYAGSGNILL